MDLHTNWSDIIQKYDDTQTVKFDDFYKQQLVIHSSVGVLDIYPNKKDIFRCFKYFNIEDTKIVIIGQDPYHGPQQATGLCFDINKNSTCKYPPSFKNIEKVLGKKADFESWANQGVLLLNSALTVVQCRPGSHIKYWLPFTKYIIDTINKKCENVIFIVWGAFALKLVEKVDTNKHTIFVSSHPSPLSCNKNLKSYPAFIKSDIFNKINKIQW